MTDAVNASPAGEDRRRRHPTVADAVFCYLILSIAGLIALRATLSSLAFIGIGWLLLIAVIPLLPWAAPRLGNLLRSISPYVGKFSVGTVEVEFRAVANRAIAVPTSGTLASLPNDLGVLSTSTGIMSLVKALRTFDLAGGAPVGIIDLQSGSKWRLPNLYFLSIVLDVDPIVTEFVFTTARGATDGYVVRACSTAEFRRQVEQALPAYGTASAAVRLPASRDLTDAAVAQELGNAFLAFQNSLPGNAADVGDPLVGYLGADRLNDLLLSPPGPVIESPGATLGEDALRAVLSAPERFVPTTTNGRLSGLIDRDSVALTVARAAVSGKA